MRILNYTLSEEFARKAKEIYFPGSEETTEQLKFESRDDERQLPMIIYSVREIEGSRVQVTLHEFKPVIKHIDLAGKESDIEKIIAAVNNDFGINLTSAELQV